MKRPGPWPVPCRKPKPQKFPWPKLRKTSAAQGPFIQHIFDSVHSVTWTPWWFPVAPSAPPMWCGDFGWGWNRIWNKVLDDDWWFQTFFQPWGWGLEEQIPAWTASTKLLLAYWFGLKAAQEIHLNELVIWRTTSRGTTSTIGISCGKPAYQWLTKHIVNIG